MSRRILKVEGVLTLRKVLLDRTFVPPVSGGCALSAGGIFLEADHFRAGFFYWCFLFSNGLLVTSVSTPSDLDSETFGSLEARPAPLNAGAEHTLLPALSRPHYILQDRLPPAAMWSSAEMLWLARERLFFFFFFFLRRCVAGLRLLLLLFPPIRATRNEIPVYLPRSPRPKAISAIRVGGWGMVATASFLLTLASEVARKFSRVLRLFPFFGFFFPMNTPLSFPFFACYIRLSPFSYERFSATSDLILIAGAAPFGVH